ncbi:MAG: hypothetical protein L0Y71_11740 [Gemmataceae bacterium]|nr:hypothetical protein [Gemmataceae bacterium]
MDFEIIGEITSIEIIAVGGSIRDLILGRTMKKRAGKVKFGLCIDNEGYAASLEKRKVYRIIPDEDAERHGDLRIVDESGEDYLFSAKRFVVMELPPRAKKAFAVASG